MAVAGPVGRFSFQFGPGGTAVAWSWTPSGQAWGRDQKGSAHLDASGARVSASNVIVQFVPYRDTGLRDTAGSPVPEAGLVGAGDVWVFSGPTVVKGRWSKPSPGDVTTYTGPDGAPIGLTPGRTWVELAPSGTTVQTQ
jgi:hypothetical protein